ncbi:MAG: hypothetical protein ACKVOI_09165 [Dongiaceae bacterium]
MALDIAPAVIASAAALAQVEGVAIDARVAPAAIFTIVKRHDELLQIPYSQKARCGRIRASAGVAASTAPDVIAIFGRAHALQLRQTYGEAGLNVRHRLAYFIAQAR